MKPHANNAGYVCERKARLGGHVVVYDREHGFDCSADYRWIVMHEPSSNHVAVRTEREARGLMKALAGARTLEEALGHADVFPRLGTNAFEADQEGAVDAPRRRRRKTPAEEARAAQAAAQAAEEAAALERFLADPENEPTPEGKAALRKAFRLK